MNILRNVTNTHKHLITSTRFYFLDNKFDSKKDYYKILEIDKDASETQIKSSYYRLAKIYHPDHNKGKQAKFKEISQAYEILSDPKSRQQYDSYRIFGRFTQNVRGKAQQGSYNYQEYSSIFENMSFQQKQRVKLTIKKLMRLAFLGSLTSLFIISFITRRPNRYYTIVDGNILPIDPASVQINPVYGAPPPQPQTYYQQPNPYQQPVSYQQPNNYSNQSSYYQPQYNYDPNYSPYSTNSRMQSNYQSNYKTADM